MVMVLDRKGYPAAGGGWPVDYGGAKPGRIKALRTCALISLIVLSSNIALMWYYLLNYVDAEGAPHSPHAMFHQQPRRGAAARLGISAPQQPKRGRKSLYNSHVNTRRGQDGTLMKLAICAVVKDEAPYLAEWATHHRMIGFDHLLLYNDHSADGTQCVLDAYARSGDVTRVPEDVAEVHMRDLPWFHAGYFRDNPQQAVFEACRRHLLDQEGRRNETGLTWMLTSDVDEFLWFDQKFPNAKIAISELISTLQSAHDGNGSTSIGSIKIPTLSFGPSGKETHESELVMKRFNRSYPINNGVSNVGKSISHVASVSRFSLPEEHSLSRGTAVKFNSTAAEQLGVRLAHYITKSREEFYDRVCRSRYFYKYFSGPPNKQSPAFFIDYVGKISTRMDGRMIPYADELLGKPMMKTAEQCKPKHWMSKCPRNLMETQNEEGFLQLAHYKASREPHRPLVFGGGFAMTGTTAMFNATCELQLRSLHWLDHCGFGDNPSVPLPGLIAHTRVIRAFEAIVRCVSLAYWGGTQPCPTVKETLDAMLSHIDAVISSKDVGAIHGAPYPEFADYVINATRRIRGTKPITLLTMRLPIDWGSRRTEGNDNKNLICRFKTKDAHGTDTSIGQNMYWCLKAGLEQGLGDKSIVDIFDIEKQFKSSIASHLSDGLKKYQEKMEAISQYHVNLLERSPQLNYSGLSLEIAGLLRAVPAIGRVPPPPWDKIPRFDHVRKRHCMSGWKEALHSGRHCDKLALFLHLHGSGGSAITDFLRSLGLVNNLKTNADEFGEIQHGSDIYVLNGQDSLRILQSKIGNQSSGDPNFWTSLYDRGIDVISLEDNFVTPAAYGKISSAAYKIAQLSDPWDRYFSVYKELEVACSSKQSDKCRMFHKDLLIPNYYTRMLNGMNRQTTRVTRSHLESAKALLASFDTVIILEDDDEINLRKLYAVFGDFGEALGSGFKEKRPIQKAVGWDDKVKAAFEDQNALDIELYEFARETFKENKYGIHVDSSNKVTCHIPSQQYAKHPLYIAATQTEPNAPSMSSQQYLIHIHGWPHTGTGWLRQVLHSSLNEMRQGSSSIQNSLLNGGKYVPEHEGQYLQNVYPMFDARSAIYEQEAVQNGTSHYGKLMYLPDVCDIDSQYKADVGNLLFSQWSRYFNMTGCTYLIQKTPTLDVQFLETLKVIPSLHVIIVRHPMTFKYLKQEDRWANWRPFHWLDSFSHVLATLATGKVEWYAVVTYESLVQHHTEVVSELMEVVRSGTERLRIHHPNSKIGAEVHEATNERTAQEQSVLMDLLQSNLQAKRASDKPHSQRENNTPLNESNGLVSDKILPDRKSKSSTIGNHPNRRVGTEVHDASDEKIAHGHNDLLDFLQSNSIAKPPLEKPPSSERVDNAPPHVSNTLVSDKSNSLGILELLNENKRHPQRHRRLELRNSSSSSFLKPGREVMSQWHKCINSPVCHDVLDWLTTNILPQFGYVSQLEEGDQLSTKPGAVTVTKEYGHVLFSSEGDALREFRKMNGHDDTARGVGGHVPDGLVKKMSAMVKSKDG